MKYSKKRRISWRDDVPLLLSAGVAVLVAGGFLAIGGTQFVKTQLFSGSNQQLAIGYYDDRTHQAEVAYAPLGSHTFAARALGSQAENAGKYMSAAFDSGSRLHLVYYNETTNSLVHASSVSSNLSDNWNIETIAPNGGKDTSIAIDPSGTMHVSYLSSDLRTLLVATGTDGNWTTHTITSGLSSETGTSMGVNAAGQEFVAYYNGSATRRSAYVATTTAGNWAATKVGDSGGSTSSISLKVDGNGNLRVAYLDDAQKNLYYASTTSGKWATTTVLTGKAQGGVSLALDDAGTPGIAYHSSTNDLLYFTYYYADYGNGAGRWLEQYADATRASGYAPSLVLSGTGSAGTVHIAEYQKDSGQITYATNKGTSGYSFVAFPAVRANDDSGSVAMALSGQSQPGGGTTTQQSPATSSSSFFSFGNPTPTPVTVTGGNDTSFTPRTNDASPTPQFSPSPSPVAAGCQLVDQALYNAHAAGTVFTDLKGPTKGGSGNFGIKNGSTCTVLETVATYRVLTNGSTSFFDQTVASVPPGVTQQFKVNTPDCQYFIKAYAGVAPAGNTVNTGQHPVIYKEIDNQATACK